MSKPRDPQIILETLLAAARKAGADAADALLVKNISAGVSYRLGKLEDIERGESADLGLRVFVGNQVAFVSSTDFSADALAALPGARRRHGEARAGRQIRRPRAAELLARAIPALDLDDPQEPSAETLVERARAVEQARRWRSRASPIPKAAAPLFALALLTLATSEGFLGGYAGTSHSIALR